MRSWVGKNIIFDQQPMAGFIFTEQQTKKMKTRITLIVFILCAGFVNDLAAQDSIPAVASDTLVVLWSSGDPEVAEKACLMYTGYAKRLGWFREVILLFCAKDTQN